MISKKESEKFLSYHSGGINLFTCVSWWWGEIFGSGCYITCPGEWNIMSSFWYNSLTVGEKHMVHPQSFWVHFHAPLCFVTEPNDCISLKFSLELRKSSSFWSYLCGYSALTVWSFAMPQELSILKHDTVSRPGAKPDSNVLFKYRFCFPRTALGEFVIFKSSTPMWWQRCIKTVPTERAQPNYQMKKS